MTQADGYRDPERVELSRSIFEPSSLGTVAEAISVATEDEQFVYVERIGNAWRWSLTHQGGPYPLLRISARFLHMDYHDLIIGCRYPAEGVCVLTGGPGSDLHPAAWAVIEFDGPTEPQEVRKRIWQSFKPGGTASAWQQAD